MKVFFLEIYQKGVLFALTWTISMGVFATISMHEAGDDEKETTLQQQGRVDIKGKVLDSDGNSMPSVTGLVVGTSSGITTDIEDNGYFIF